jgi:hypothetical protein
MGVRKKKKKKKTGQGHHRAGRRTGGDGKMRGNRNHGQGAMGMAWHGVAWHGIAKGVWVERHAERYALRTRSKGIRQLLIGCWQLDCVGRHRIERRVLGFLHRRPERAAGIAARPTTPPREIHTACVRPTTRGNRLHGTHTTNEGMGHTTKGQPGQGRREGRATRTIG